MAAIELTDLVQDTFDPDLLMHLFNINDNYPTYHGRKLKYPTHAEVSAHIIRAFGSEARKRADHFWFTRAYYALNAQQLIFCTFVASNNSDNASDVYFAFSDPSSRSIVYPTAKPAPEGSRSITLLGEKLMLTIGPKFLPGLYSTRKLLKWPA